MDHDGSIHQPTGWNKLFCGWDVTLSPSLILRSAPLARVSKDGRESGLASILRDACFRKLLRMRFDFLQDKGGSMALKRVDGRSPGS